MLPLRLTVATLALAHGLLLAAQPMAPPKPRGTRIAQLLHLSETQQARIQALRQQHQPDLLRLRQEAHACRATLAAALKNTTTPPDQLRALHAKAAQAQVELQLARRSLRLEVRDLLTPEQQAKADLLQDLARSRRHGAEPRGARGSLPG